MNTLVMKQLLLDGNPVTPQALLAGMSSDTFARFHRAMFAEHIRAQCAGALGWLCGEITHTPEISSFKCLTEPEQPAGRVIFENGGVVRLQRFAPTPEDEHA